eukprot:813082-Pelagomonas_calceolata.AAC.2
MSKLLDRLKAFCELTRKRGTAPELESPDHKACFLTAACCHVQEGSPFLPYWLDDDEEGGGAWEEEEMLSDGA